MNKTNREKNNRSEFDIIELELGYGVVLKDGFKIVSKGTKDECLIYVGSRVLGYSHTESKINSELINKRIDEINSKLRSLAKDLTNDLTNEKNLE